MLAVKDTQLQHTGAGRMASACASTFADLGVQVTPRAHRYQPISLVNGWSIKPEAGFSK